MTSPDAPVPTYAVIVVELTIENEVAGTPPKLTPETFVKFVPDKVTIVFVGPLEGVKEVNKGGGT